ncbi:hypothetical protein [Terricaulis sp.]|uniref:hypothetical protein n=1 Tax=Terricaulis sp. TaxID=2768686 RepID=UPI003784F9F8
MTVTGQSSVFIVGAGCSAPFRLPLGGQLLEQVGAQIESELQSIEEDKRRGYTDDGWKTFWRRPMICVLDREKQWRPDRLHDLKRLLVDQTSETIDDFIVENLGFANLTKLAVATVLFKRCHSGGLHGEGCLVANFATRLFGAPPLRNWIHLFINVVRQGIRLGEVSPTNKLQVITFNYDTILEQVLDSQFSNTESNYGDWRKYIEVTHVHGQFPPLGVPGSNVASPAAQIASWAEGIHVVHEGQVPEHIKAARDKARQLVGSAKEIYAAGFAFGASNCKLLGLRDSFKSDGVRTFSYCNWNGDIGIKKSVEQVARWEDPDTVIDEGAGTADKHMEVEAWIRAGYLGEMPA